MPMTPVAVFFKTLSRTSAIFIGTAAMFLHPPLDWGSGRSVAALKGPRQATIDTLVGAMRDPDASVRREVARALEAYAVIDAQRASVAELTAQLASTDVVSRTRAACQLKEIGNEAEPALNALLAMLADGTPVPRSVCGERWRRGDSPMPTSPGEQAASALAEIGSPALAPLMRTLKHTSWTARRNAAWALGAIDDHRAVTALIGALKDNEATVREQVAWALGAIGDSAAVTALIEALKDEAAKVREQAAWALGAIGENAAVDGLVRALRDSDGQVREQAAWALGAIGEPRAIDALLPLLKDADVRVRRQAAWAIGVVTK
jgi:HEAT repeat protein